MKENMRLWYKQSMPLFMLMIFSLALIMSSITFRNDILDAAKEKILNADTVIIITVVCQYIHYFGYWLFTFTVIVLPIYWFLLEKRDIKKDTEALMSQKNEA